MNARDLVVLAVLGACAVGCDPHQSQAVNGGTDDSGTTSSSVSTDPSTSGSSGSGSSGEADPAGCVETPTMLQPGAEGPTGMDPTSVIADAEGRYVGTLEWLEDGFIPYDGPLGRTDLEIELRYLGGPIVDVDAELTGDCDNLAPCPCPDHLDITMRMTIVAGDGSLDEAWDVVVGNYPSGDGFRSAGTWVSHRVSPMAIAGTVSESSFDVPDDFVLEDLIWDGRVGSDAFSGYFGVQLAGQGAQEGVIGGGSLAAFAALRSSAGCTVLDDDEQCERAGCEAVAGQRLAISDPGVCSCAPAEDYCFAAPLGGEPTPTRYTRNVDAYYDEVVLFASDVANPPSPWRRCDQAPQIEECSCSLGNCP